MPVVWQSKQKRFPSLDEHKFSDLGHGEGNLVIAFEFCE